MSEAGARIAFVRRAWSKYWRTALLICGVLAVASIVRAIGPLTIGLDAS